MMNRQLEGTWKWIAGGTALALVGFHLYTGAFGLLPEMEQRAVHVLLGLCLTFMLVPAEKSVKSVTTVPVYDILAMIGVVAFCVNYFFKYEWYIDNISKSTATDIVLGILAIVLSLEAARRSIGWFFPVFIILLILYAFFGDWIPGWLGHPRIRPLYMLQSVYQAPAGVWGFVTGLSATVIAMFVIFGAFVLFTGGGDSFFKIATKVSGWLPGGPALVAVVASSLFGTISGSTVANVVTTGSFTIPTMKRLGYSSAFAGAVEAVASTGGQIMPPIMGAGAFIMAEMLGVSYLSIVINAIIPALLYYIAVFICVLLQAQKQGLPPLPKEQIPRIREVLSWPVLVPVVVPIGVLLGMLIYGRSLVTCGFWACASALVLYAVKDFSPANMSNRMRKAIVGLVEGGKAFVSIVALLVTANIAVKLMGLSGLAVKVSGMVISTGQNNLALAYLLCSVMALMLGMGLPAIPAYIVAASVGVPALVKLGVPDLQAQFFVFYFACMGSITPPVCAAVYAAAPIAKASWLRIAFHATRLGIVAYLVPFVFIEEPTLLMLGHPMSIIGHFILSLLAVLLIAPGVMGYFTLKKFRGNINIPARVFVFGAGVCILLPLGQYRFLALPLLALSVILHRVPSWLRRDLPGSDKLLS
jgi:TRAP transporter 4TM/12TM fusion protein